MNVSMKKTNKANTKLNNTFSAKRLLLVLTLSFSLIFAACGSSDDGDLTRYDTGTSSSNSSETTLSSTQPDTTPSEDSVAPAETETDNPENNVDSSSGGSDISMDSSPGDDDAPTVPEPGTDPSREERINLLKNILYATYSGIWNSSTDYQANTPLYNVMVNNLNELAVTLALKAFQAQGMNNLFQHEDLMATIESIMGMVNNDALMSKLEVLMTNFQKDNIITTIENLISNFNELIAAIQDKRFTDIPSIISNSMELISIIDFNELHNLINNEILADTIQESISTIATKLFLLDPNVEDMIENIENAINTIKSQIIADATNNGLLDSFSNLLVQWMIEGKNSITYSDENVTTTITITGIENILSGQEGELTLRLSADFNASGYTLESSSCTYTGDGDGSPDFEALVVISISDAIPMIDVKSVEITAFDTLHASYPTHEIQYEDWTVFYKIDTANLLNASFLNMVEDMIQYTENYRDNRDYMVNGSFALNGEKYDISEMHYVKQEQEDGTSHLSINGNMFANLLGTDISVDVSSDAIKCNHEGLWFDSQLGININQDIVNIIFDWNGNATIEGETVSLWQEVLNPLN